MPPRSRPSVLFAVVLGVSALIAGGVACNLTVTKNPAEDPGKCTEGCGVALTPDAGDGGVSQGAGGSVGSTYNAICGTGCVPDLEKALSSCMDAAVGPDAADAAFDAPATDGMTNDPPPPPPPTALACTLTRGAPPVATAVCLPFGDGQDGAGCETSADCAAGYGCVTSVDDAMHATGQCRAYCCGGIDVCPTTTYCANVPLFEPSKPNDPFPVPVCIVPAVKCQLLGTDCPAGETCSIVNGQTTACVSLGNSVDGEPCPCAAGYVCAKPTNICLRLCRTSETGGCDGGTCVGGSATFPSGFGICAF